MRQILLSELKALGFADAPAFHAALEAYRQALLAHRSTQGEPAPVPPHPCLEAFIRRVQADGAPDDFVPDADVVDDTPPPPTLDERRAQLLADVARLESAAIALILPPGKMRLAQMDYARAGNTPAAERTPEQQACIADHAAMRVAIEAVQYHAAVLCAEIDDLTDETVERWRPRPFP
jgi:hypothetical protein